MSQPKRLHLVAVAAASLLLASGARADHAATSLAFVQGMGINNNFGQMMRFGAGRMQTHRHILCAAGAAEGRRLAEQEMTAVIGKYQSQWDKNLSTAWMQLLSEGEMTSLLELKRQSPFAAKYQGAGPEAGKLMMASSSGMLTRAMSEGMNNAWEKASPGVAHNAATPCKN